MLTEQAKISTLQRAAVAAAAAEAAAA